MNLVKIDIIMPVKQYMRIRSNSSIPTSSLHLLSDENYVAKIINQNISQDDLPENYMQLIRSGEIRLEINKN